MFQNVNKLTKCLKMFHNGNKVHEYLKTVKMVINFWDEKIERMSQSKNSHSIPSSRNRNEIHIVKKSQSKNVRPIVKMAYLTERIAF